MRTQGDGWRSRKLWVAVLAMALIFIGFIMCGRPAALYSAYCGWLLAAAGLFKTANLLEKKLKPGEPPTA